MTKAENTTARPCLNRNCQHGASAHKWRYYQYLPYKAECEHCDCARYQDPLVTNTERRDGNFYPRPRNRALSVPFPLPTRKREKWASPEHRRDYWRQKQRESRERRKIELSYGPREPVVTT